MLSFPKETGRLGFFLDIDSDQWTGSKGSRGPYQTWFLLGLEICPEKWEKQDICRRTVTLTANDCVSRRTRRRKEVRGPLPLLASNLK